MQNINGGARGTAALVPNDYIAGEKMTACVMKNKIYYISIFLKSYQSHRRM